jgi:hypothetical protein
LTIWHLVCQKSYGILLLQDVSHWMETNRAHTETNQGVACYG